jgi:hypothetical protein
VLGRESLFAPRSGTLPGVAPRLYQVRYGNETRFEVSASLEGDAEYGNQKVRYAPNSGLHTRFGLETQGWLAFTHLTFGYQDTARVFADPLFPKTNAIAFSDESYLGYTGPRGGWGFQFGRSRWHWGPGEEGSLLLSKTSVALTGLAIHARLEPLHADGIALSATLQSAAGEQLAAHRLEWQPSDGLRIGLSEAARYQASAWQPLYLMGVLPYVLVQRILDQDEPGPTNRNNIMVSTDVAWRVAPGTRLYGELLADDIHPFHDTGVPTKYAYQVGWEGAGTFRGTRLVWGTEFTRVTRYVYTSYFGRDFTSQGRSLGYPLAPDSRRLRVHLAWDLSPAWQLTGGFARTEKGENSLTEPFVPDVTPPPVGAFEGVVEETREVDGGLRWWPSGGVDLLATAGYRWTDNADHVSGATAHDPHVSLAFRLVR